MDNMQRESIWCLRERQLEDQEFHISLLILHQIHGEWILDSDNEAHLRIRRDSGEQPV